MKLSGIQRDVISLYRSCLREAAKKPPETRTHFKDFARAEFQKYIHINKRDFATIEHLLRVGKRKLEVYSQPGIKDIMR